MISSISSYIPINRQIAYDMIHNLEKISGVAIPLFAMASLPTTNAGLVSYLTCAGSCLSMAAFGVPELFQYTYESCMISCEWLMSPACP